MASTLDSGTPIPATSRGPDPTARQKSIMDLVSSGSAMLLDEDYRGFIVFADAGRFLAVGHALAALDFNAVTPDVLQSQIAQGQFQVGDTLELFRSEISQ